jgi:hypothetical protein
MVGYFAVNMESEGFLDWEWLLSRPSFQEKTFTKLLRFDKPVTIMMNGHKNTGVILKPEE